MPNSLPLISIIVCTRNRASIIEETLGSLTRATVPPGTIVEIIVVDNGSSDGTGETLARYATQVDGRLRPVREAEGGKSAALNCGIRAARGNLLLFTDDDVQVDPGWIEAFTGAFAGDDKVVGCVGRVLPAFSSPPPKWLTASRPFPYRMDFGTTPPPGRTFLPFGANMAFRRIAFERYGLFRLDLGPAPEAPWRGREDAEFGLRLHRHGERLAYVPSATVKHPVGPHQLTRSFLRHWWFREGRSRCAAESPAKGRLQVFGVPAWLFGVLWDRFRAALSHADSDDRFFASLSAWMTLGTIWQAFLDRKGRHTSRRGPAPPPPLESPG